MSIAVNVRQLDQQGLELRGELPVAELDLDLQDEVVQVLRPLRYALRAEHMGGGILLQGRLELRVQCTCVRCLRVFERTIGLEDWAGHVPLEGDEAAAVVNDLVDLTPFVREDILLALPQHPLCEPGCGGLPSAPRREVPSTDRGQPAGGVSVWAELDKLKL